MWKPPLNFITLHYAYIISLGILGLILIYPYGNMPAVDAYFFGVSASTESGLNTIDVKDLKTYQQLVIYFSPIISNLAFINIIVVVVRLLWFEKRLKHLAPRWETQSTINDVDREAQAYATGTGNPKLDLSGSRLKETDQADQADQEGVSNNNNQSQIVPSTPNVSQGVPTRITFAPDSLNRPRQESNPLYVPSPRDRDGGRPITERDEVQSNNENEIMTITSSNFEPGGLIHRTSSRANAASIKRVASSIFVVGRASVSEEAPKHQSDMSLHHLPYLSSQATVGRNSQFHNLTSEDREKLGGIEYRSLKLLLKIVVVYFFGLHLFGAICLVGWIQNAPPKYTEYLKDCGQDKIWWGFYSAQTMVDNLGFTLTPDSMITFQDATFPLLIMSFLAYAGNTCYPILLRLVIWTMSKLVPRRSSMQEPLKFLLEHPRRCYTLLFPSRPTWLLFGILLVMNFIDVLLIIVLDLNNTSVNNLPSGPRVLAAIFQAASSRHTGTATFNLADVNPAVQFSLLVMMYIAVYPIAISVRASNTYEEKSLGVYSQESEVNERNGTSYFMMHLQNQLSFDLWYIFLGIFCICAAESSKIMDDTNPAFAVFPIFFEVVSAYGNVGLSLGHPDVLTSLCGKFTPFSKLVICAMMIRGRHRGLPYQLDRAILLPGERQTLEMEDTTTTEEMGAKGMLKMKRYRTA